MLRQRHDTQRVNSRRDSEETTLRQEGQVRFTLTRQVPRSEGLGDVRLLMT